MTTPLVMTFIGRDKPGLVNTISRKVAEHGGDWPALTQLTPIQREQVNGSVAGALAALDELAAAVAA